MDRHAAGHTLLELLTALAIVAVGATLAVPTLADWRANAARDERVGRLQRTLLLARTEALARGRPVTICAAAGTRCAADGRWSGGWLVFVDARPPRGQRSPDEPVIAADRGRDAPRVYSTRRAIEFLPSAAAATTATLVVCDRRGRTAARAVVVSRTGRVRVAREIEAGAAPGCA